MRGIRSQHDPAAPRPDANHLQPHGVAADMVQGEAGCELRIAVMEADAPAIDLAHQSDDILDTVGLAEGRLRHMAAGGVTHLLVLDVEARPRKAIDIADMVVVEVRHDHVLDRGGIDSDEAQRVDRIADDLALAQPGGRLIEAEVYNDGAAVTADRP